MKRDYVTAIFWVIFGTVIFIWSATFPFGERKAPGPAFLPLACGLLLIVLGSILLIQIWVTRKRVLPGSSRPFLPRGRPLLRVLVTLGIIGLSTLFLEALGFVATAFLMLLFLKETIQTEKVKAALFYAFVSTLGSVIVFQLLLKIRFPKGPFGF